MSGDDPHIPVKLAEEMTALGDELAGKRIVDGTFGAGGYTRTFLDRGANVEAFDRDPSARPAATHVVLDVGVSSMQLDQAERGFSFMRDGPLDMRMAQSGPTAADVVNDYAVSDLIRIIGILGEDRNASRIAHAIVDARQEALFSTTKELVAAIERAAPRRGKDKIHPASRTIQGLRVFVNDEALNLRVSDALRHVLCIGAGFGVFQMLIVCNLKPFSTPLISLLCEADPAVF